MAIPATGSAVTMTQIYTYFSASGAYSLGNLGTYMGISVGNTINMSATFGGQGT